MITVRNEISPLRTVLLHRPGRELEHLSPHTMEQLLFDDIPYLYKAQEEHDAFAATLRGHGVEVLYLEDLAADVIRDNPEIRKSFIDQVIEEAGGYARGYREDLTRYLSAIEDAKALVEKTMEGVTFRELFPARSGHLSDLVSTRERFLMPPMPNLYFTRDPFASIGSGVSLNHMATAVRNRETIFGRLILNYHPRFGKSVKKYYRTDYPFSIEGGDILNLSPEVLAVGLSERTQPEAAELLAENLFSDESCEKRTVLAFEIPQTRAFMHLDTVFTQIDVNRFVVHPQILETLCVYEMTPGKKSAATGKIGINIRRVEGSLQKILETYLHLDCVELIRCGGGPGIAAEREQWNDGSNTLCVRPGTVIVYDRNYVTNGILREHGIDVIEVPGSELSRGRGGPRCMSMPLVRS